MEAEALKRHLMAVPDDKQEKIDAALERRLARLKPGEALPKGISLSDVEALEARQEARRRSEGQSKAYEKKGATAPFHVPGIDDRKVFNEAQIEFTGVKRRKDDDSVSLSIRIGAEMQRALEMLIKLDSNSFVNLSGAARHGLVLCMYEALDRPDIPKEVRAAINYETVIQRQENQHIRDVAIQALLDSTEKAQRDRRPKLVAENIELARTFLETEEEGSAQWRQIVDLIERLER